MPVVNRKGGYDIPQLNWPSFLHIFFPSLRHGFFLSSLALRSYFPSLLPSIPLRRSSGKPIAGNSEKWSPNNPTVSGPKSSDGVPTIQLLVTLKTCTSPLVLSEMPRAERKKDREGEGRAFKYLPPLFLLLFPSNPNGNGFSQPFPVKASTVFRWNPRGFPFRPLQIRWRRCQRICHLWSVG